MHARGLENTLLKINVLKSVTRGLENTRLFLDPDLFSHYKCRQPHTLHEKVIIDYYANYAKLLRLLRHATTPTTAREKKLFIVWATRRMSV